MSSLSTLYARIETKVEPPFIAPYHGYDNNSYQDVGLSLPKAPRLEGQAQRFSDVVVSRLDAPFVVQYQALSSHEHQLQSFLIPASSVPDFLDPDFFELSIGSIEPVGSPWDCTPSPRPSTGSIFCVEALIPHAVQNLIRNQRYPHLELYIKVFYHPEAYPEEEQLSEDPPGPTVQSTSGEAESNLAIRFVSTTRLVFSSLGVVIGNGSDGESHARLRVDSVPQYRADGSSPPACGGALHSTQSSPQKPLWMVVLLTLFFASWFFLKLELQPSLILTRKFARPKE